MGYLLAHSRGTRVISTNLSAVCRANLITSIFSSGIWQGKKCFLLGGGPSLIHFDYNLVKDYPTIGINKTFTVFSPTINYAMDTRFYDMVTYGSMQDESIRKLRKKWGEYKGVKLFLRRSSKFRFDSSVYYVDALPEKALSFNLDKGIWPGNNSGFGALMLAIALGCKRIGLLGYDLKVITGRTHWHNGYPGQDVRSLQRKLDKFIMCFEEFADCIKSHNIEVVNLNPESKLECFPKGTLRSFLEKK